MISIVHYTKPLLLPSLPCIQIWFSRLGAALVVKLSGTYHFCDELPPCVDELTNKKCFCDAWMRLP